MEASSLVKPGTFKNLLSHGADVSLQDDVRGFTYKLLF